MGQDRNRFVGHIVDIKHVSNTTAARHFVSHMMTIHIPEYIMIPKDINKSNLAKDQRELVWIH